MPDDLRAPYPGDLRQDLLDAAVDDISSGGPSRVSLRAIARRVGVSHAAPKNHFTTKQALFTAVAVEGHRLLDDTISREVGRVGGDDGAGHGGARPVPGGGADVVALLAASGRAYLRFAADHPAHFAVMFRDDLLDLDDPDLTDAAGATLGRVASLAEASTADLGVAPDDLPDLVLLAWSLVHGLASLQATTDLTDIVGERPRNEVDDAVVGLMSRVLRGGA